VIDLRAALVDTCALCRGDLEMPCASLHLFAAYGSIFPVEQSVEVAKGWVR